MVLKNSIVGFQITSVLIVQEEEGHIIRLLLQKNIHADKITTYGSFEYNSKQYFYTGSFDKFIKFWTLEGDQLILVNSAIVQKKVTHSFWSASASKHFVTDKYGDIYSLDIEKILKIEGDLHPEYMNNNLAIQQSFKDITISQERVLCVLGDSYSKIKMFDLNNMHNLTNVWVPFESHLTSILEFSQKVVFLFQMKDSITQEKRYAIHLTEKAHFNENNYPSIDSVNIDEIKFAHNTLKVRIEKRNEQEFLICSITKSGQVTAILYNITSRSIVSEQTAQLGFTTQPGQQYFLHLAQLANTTLALIGIKLNTPQDAQIQDVFTLEISPSLVLKHIHEKADLLIV